MTDKGHFVRVAVVSVLPAAVGGEAEKIYPAVVWEMPAIYLRGECADQLARHTETTHLSRSEQP